MSFSILLLSLLLPLLLLRSCARFDIVRIDWRERGVPSQRYTHVFNIIIIVVVDDGIPFFFSFFHSFSRPHTMRNGTFIVSLCVRWDMTTMTTVWWRKYDESLNNSKFIAVYFQVTLPSDFIEMIRQFPTYNRWTLTACGGARATAAVAAAQHNDFCTFCIYPLPLPV